MRKIKNFELYRGLEKAVALLRRTDWYYELHETRFKKILLIAEQILRHKPNADVLEVGVWPGYLAMSCLYAGHHVDGIDLDPQRLPKEVTAKINIAKQDLNNIMPSTFNEKKYDLIIVSEVIEHLEPDKLPVLFSEIGKILKEDGVLILTTPNKNQLNSIWQWDDGNKKTANGHGHVKEYIPKELLALLLGAGFCSTKICYENFYDLVGKKVNGRYFTPIYKIWRGNNYVRNFLKLLSWPIRRVPYLKDSIVVEARIKTK